MIEVGIAGPQPHTDDEISLVDFADTFAAKTNSLNMPDMHPAGANTIWDWLCEMRAAAEAGMVTEKVAWEREQTNNV